MQESLSPTSELLEIRGYPKYKYDQQSDTVVSFQTGSPFPLKWCLYYSREQVALYNKRGRRTIGRNELQTLIVKKENKLVTKYIIGSISKNSDCFSLADYPKKHDSLSLARSEAERLAKIHLEKKFVVLEIKGVVSVNDVKWENV